MDKAIGRKQEQIGLLPDSIQVVIYSDLQCPKKRETENYYLPSRAKCSGWASDNWAGRIRVKRRIGRSAKYRRPSLPGNNGLHNVSHVAR